MADERDTLDMADSDDNQRLFYDLAAVMPKVEPKKDYSFHLERFFLALHEEVLEAFQDLHSSVFPLVDWVEIDYSESGFFSHETGNMPQASLDWLARWKINPVHFGALRNLFGLIHMTCNQWQTEPENLERLAAPDILISRIQRQILKPKKMEAPKYNPRESRQDYLRRAKQYHANEAIRYAMKEGLTVSRVDIALAQPKSKLIDTTPKRKNRMRYRWAAYTQCHKNVNTYNDAAAYFGISTNRFDSFEREVRHTLNECGLTGVKSPYFDI